MDKNYNVDDILSEIKRRKRRQRDVEQAKTGKHSIPEPVFTGEHVEESVEEPVLSQPHAKTRFDFVPQQQPEPQRSKPKPSRPKPQPQERHEPQQEQRKTMNPMDFTGHVRPITDKARMRHTGRMGSFTKQPPQTETAAFRFQFPHQEDAPEQRVESSQPNRITNLDKTQEHTRVLPKFSTSRELNMEDIQKMNIGARAQDAVDDIYYDEEDYLQDSLPGNSSIDFSEYNSEEDRKAVATDIARVKLWLFLRVTLTAILTGVLFFFTYAAKYPQIPLPPAIWPEGKTIGMYLLAITLGTVLVALVNSSAVGGGIISLLKMRANSDSLAALALLAAIGQAVITTVSPDTFDPMQLNLYYGIASLSMLFNGLGKLTMINRIQSNFRILGSDRPKKALLPLEWDAFCREFIGEEGGRRPTIAYSVPANFFTDFLALSYSDKYDVGVHRAVAPVCLLGALIVGGATYFLTDSMASAISALTAVLCVCATLSATFIENIPLGKLTKRLAPQGGMVSGNKAVEDFCDTAALVLSEKDLFPEGHVQLCGIKAYSQGRIDEAIVDAASVLCAIDGALSPLFMQMLGGNKRLLKKVDNIVFEDGMGLSAWVDSRRVLIGNRDLMQNHGIDIPQDDPQKLTITQGEGDPLYVAASGEVTARFVVSYHIDEQLAVQLDQMALRDKVLIVYTSDANITPQKIWELYGYPEELIRILPSEWHESYREVIKPRETALAGIVHTGRADTLIKCILACITARSSILTATIIQLIQIVAGYGLIAFMAFMGVIATLSITQLVAYQIFWFLAIFIVQQAKHA